MVNVARSGASCSSGASWVQSVVGGEVGAPQPKCTSTMLQPYEAFIARWHHNISGSTKIKAASHLPREYRPLELVPYDQAHISWP